MSEYGSTSSASTGVLAPLAEAAALVRDGQTVALGGSLLHRAPNAFARELARSGRRDLTFVKPSPGYDLDLLAAAGALDWAEVGIALMEAGFGLLPSFRRAVERGDLRLREHA